MKKKQTALIVALLSLLIVGCTAPPRVDADPDQAGGYPHIVAQDDLNDFLTYGPVVVKHPNDQAMQISVTIRSLEDDRQRIQYRFTFFDKAGQPLTPQMDWRQTVLPGKIRRFLSATSLNAQAVDWRLEIRVAR